VPSDQREAEPWADVVALGSDFLARLAGDLEAEKRAKREGESKLVRSLMDRERRRNDRHRHDQDVGRDGAPMGAEAPNDDGAPWGAP
jgi:hypothetical protein